MRQCAKEKSDMEALELEILAGLMDDDEDQDQQDMPNPTETSIHTSASTKASGDGPIKKDTVTEWKQSDMRIPVGNHVAQTVDPKAINRPVKALRSRRALESSAKVPGNFSGPGNINILSTTDTHDTTPLEKQSPPVTPLQTQPVASNHDEPTHIGREEFPSVAQQSRSELSHPPIPSRASQPSLSSAPKKEDSRKKYDWSGFYTNRAGKEFIVGGDDSFYEDDGQQFTFDNQGYPVDATTKRPYLK
ncbi:hypothetical protein BKA66DRAFT_474433 [Pyrenochaeta sp. MPI-SDFR-AT-0127]|nr:hypothetical protein BKA66DRAFT_474433 [Pyrenochaeta sp. MPI-SDFR-AT-0127]